MGLKYLDDLEVEKLLRTVTEKAEKKFHCPVGTSVRDWMIVEIGLGAGLRAKEIYQLNCGDLLILNDHAQISVREGKRKSKNPQANPRIVEIDDGLKQRLLLFLRWKKDRGEEVEGTAPLLLSRVMGKRLSKSAIQRSFKRTVIKAGLDHHLSIHALRHTFARITYEASGYDIRWVQEQLGHSSVAITEKYLKFFNPSRRQNCLFFAKKLRRPHSPIFLKKKQSAFPQVSVRQLEKELWLM